MCELCIAEWRLVIDPLGWVSRIACDAMNPIFSRAPAVWTGPLRTNIWTRSINGTKGQKLKQSFFSFTYNILNKVKKRKWFIWDKCSNLEGQRSNFICKDNKVEFIYSFIITINLKQRGVVGFPEGKLIWACFFWLAGFQRQTVCARLLALVLDSDFHL